MQWSGKGLFSLRPEAIHLAEHAPQTPDGVRFRGTISKQIYGGASEILEIECGDNRFLRVRIPASGPLAGEHEFIFSARDAVSVGEFAYRGPERKDDSERR
jgi:hypothetical protein